MPISNSTEHRPPGEIWDKTTSIDHHTFVAVARAYRADRDDAPNDNDTGGIALTPYIGQNKGDWFVISLKASSKLPGHLVEFEEAAQVVLDTDLQLTFDELREFGSEYVLPFLLPYVESGFTRMCREVDERPPRFPFITMQGMLLKHPAFSEASEAGDDEEQTRGRHSRDEAASSAG